MATLDAQTLRSSLQTEGVLLSDIKRESTVKTLLDLCHSLGISPEALADRMMIYNMQEDLADEEVTPALAEKFAAYQRSVVPASKRRAPAPLVNKRKASTFVEDMGLMGMMGFKSEPGTAMKAPRTDGVEPELLASPDGTGRQPSFSSPGARHAESTQMTAGDKAFASRHPRRKIETQYPAPAAVKQEQVQGPGYAPKPVAPTPAYSAHMSERSSPPALGGLPAVAADTQYMYQKTADVCRALRQRLHKHAERMLGAEAAAEAMDVPLASTQGAVTVVGRGCCGDGATKLDKKEVMLELASGERARLDVCQVGNYSVFPGQIVAATGVMTANDRDKTITMRATDMHVGPHVGYKGDAKREKRVAGAADGGGVRAIMAAGPYTTANSLKYAPLEALLQVAEDEKPDLLLLCGPFVDERGFSAAAGKLPKFSSFDDIFHDCVLTPLAHFARARSPTTRVVLVPSLRDVHAHFVYPQPPLATAPGSHLAKDITFLPNPSTFTCKGVTFGVSTAEVLKSLSGAACIDPRRKFEGGAGRMAHLAQMCVEQRSFMPLMPPPADIPFDVSSAARAASVDMAAAPDVLLLPSDLKFMANACAEASCAVVNPGRLCKGSSAGTFARMLVARHAAAAKGGAQDVCDAKVDIVRI